MIEKMLPELVVLSIVIFALVAWLKQLGVRKRALTISAFVIGLILGIAYRYAMMPLVTFTDWFIAVIFGLLAGCTATGAYDGVRSATTPTLDGIQIAQLTNYDDR